MIFMRYNVSLPELGSAAESEENYIVSKEDLKVLQVLVLLGIFQAEAASVRGAKPNKI